MTTRACLTNQWSSQIMSEATRGEEADEHGDVIMAQTREHYELRVDQQTGSIYSKAVPVYEPEMRSLTTQELAD